MSAIIDLMTEYWWVLAILVGIVAFYIFNKMETSTKRSIEKIFSRKVLFVLGVAGAWYFWHRSGDIVTLSSANRWMPILLLLVLSAYNYMGRLQYETQQLWCSNGFHGSYSKPPTCINGFLIFAIDSFNAGGISWDWAGRVCILREETCEFGDSGCVSIASPTPCNTGVYELPDEIRTFIENNKYLKGRSKPILYGWFDDLNRVDYNIEQLHKLDKLKGDDKAIYSLLEKEFKVKNPKISTLYWTYKNLCKQVSKTVEQFDATVESVEKGVEHSKRVKDAYDIPSKPQPSVEGHEEY